MASGCLGLGTRHNNRFMMPMQGTGVAAQNRYIPLDVRGVRERKKREKEQCVDIVAREHWKKYKIAVGGNFESPVVATTFSCRASSSDCFGLLLGGSTRVDFVRIETTAESKQTHRREVVRQKAYSRFKGYVRCIALRSDERLVAAGDDTGSVHVVEARSRTLLRRLTGHKGPVRSCTFARGKLPYLLTGGDDTSLRLWDVSDGDCIIEVPNAHADVVRCIASGVPLNAESLMFASGGYDGCIKIWSFAVKTTGKSKIPVDQASCCNEKETSMPSYDCLMNLHHGYPVESLAFFPNGENPLLVSAGGPEIKVWDLSGAGTLLHSLLSHMKTVTAVDIAPDGSYIVSGSLDQTVKFHCPSTFTLLHSYVYDQAVTALAVSRSKDQAELFAVGLGDGQWVVRQRLARSDSLANFQSVTCASLRHIPVCTTRFFKRGREVLPAGDDIVVDSAIAKRSSWLDRLIQGFNHQRSLDEAITKGPAATVALIESLIEQNALHIAVRGRDETSILPLLVFIHREFCRDTTTTPVLLEFAHILLAENPWLRTTTDQAVLLAVERISSKLDVDIAQHQILRELVGILEIVSSSTQMLDPEVA